MQPILFIDGACNLCNGTVRFVHARERDAVLGFAPLQSELAAERLVPHGIDPLREDSVILLDDDGVHLRSEAAWRLAGYLRSPWRWAGVMRWLPRGLRDWGYDVVARNRFRWFGTHDLCDLPAPELAARFLDQVSPERAAALAEQGH